MANFKDILNAAENALGVIVAAGGVAGKIPGVGALPYVGTVLKFISYGKKAVEVGKVIESDLTDFVDSFANGLPSEEKRAALDARIAANHAEIQAFTPVAEPGEPE